MRNRLSLSWVAVFVLLVSVTARAQESDLTGVIEHELIEEGIRTVDVNVLDSTVELTGTVDSNWERSRAEELALDHDRVELVRNQIVVESERSDDSIAEDVARRLRNYVHYDIFDLVGARVRDGVVTLSGKVTQGYKATEMAKMATRVPGVQRVENEIEVLPASPHDRELRNSIASRIYGDSLFFDYSIQGAPPIHILVENGRVTLTGVVRTRVEKRKAELIARQTPGAFQVNNELEVSS